MLVGFLHSPGGGHDQVGAGLSAQGRIQAQIVVLGLAPAVLGVIVVVACTGAVMLGQLGLPQAVRHVFGVGAALGKLDAGLQRRVDEGAQHVGALTQDVVTAAAQNDAGALGGQLLDDVALQNVDLVGQGHRVAHHVQAVDQAAAALVLAGGNGLLGQTALFGGKGDQLLII